MKFVISMWTIKMYMHFSLKTAAPAYKCVFEFDTENLLINVYKPDSLGKDTNVVLGFS